MSANEIFGAYKDGEVHDVAWSDGGVKPLAVVPHDSDLWFDLQWHLAAADCWNHLGVAIITTPSLESVQ
jgi:hypothetical protein